MFRAKLRQRGENLIEQSRGIGDSRKDKLDFVDVQYFVLKDGLGRGKEAASDASRVQEGEHICEVVAVAVVESQ